VRDLLAPLSDQLKECGQTRVHDEVDLPLSWVLADMEMKGIAVDVSALKALGADLAGRLEQLEREIHAHAGRSFNVGSPKQLGEVLFDELKLPVIKKTKSGYSTDAEVLERLADKHPIASKLLEYRKLDKLITTYTDVLQAAVHERTGRVHATFQQTVGVTGRLITMDPDLQRTPVKTPEGQRIREAFVARPLPDGTETRLVDADWSQIELRLLAHFSEDPILIECFTHGVDVHRRTAAEVLGKNADEVTKQERELGKTVNFATIYGQGANGLAQLLGIAKKDAERTIARYFEVYAGVRAYSDRMVALAHERGYAETLLGRRRIIPELKSRSPMDRGFGERVAQNTPIQGSAADICKLAMFRIHERLRKEAPRTRLLLQIHDELVLESPLEEIEATSALVKDVMEHVVPLKVPLVADVGVGRSWGEAKR
jgi:DNA polymerase I